jgi:hypothetical protein
MGLKCRIGLAEPKNARSKLINRRSGKVKNKRMVRNNDPFEIFFQNP